MKMLMLIAAGLNMAAFHLLTMRGISLWDKDAPVPLAAKAAGFLSLIIWALIVAFGRWIGFTTLAFLGSHPFPGAGRGPVGKARPRPGARLRRLAGIVRRAAELLHRLAVGQGDGDVEAALAPVLSG